MDCPPCALNHGKALLKTLNEVMECPFGVGGRGVWSARAVDDAVKFSSWAEAAAVAAFIIHHIDEMYEEALDNVKVDL